MSEVNSADLLEIVAPIWHVKAETARVVRQRLRTVLERAVAVEWRSYNPCDRIGPVLGAQGDILLDMRALPNAEVAAAVETVRTSESTAPTIKLAFEFLGSGRPVAASTLPKMLQLHGIPDVAHRFRSSCRDWAAERTDHPREVIEAALAHVVPNKVEADYARSDLFERRRLLMDDWAAYVNCECWQEDSSGALT